ncbi:RNA-directed DNA polymerase, eukaryota, reverse transcriptase zinc-binding domain protein [Tanacetum coccineum]|uniref:RNA-directed DNA polymerase, eukaryota, reverse transcriptase zinc-binding domain protein n=1 Tax=Tanacetum coccineum TaxID=301880 RepID=A0ABQ4X1Z8_9ASTR
MRDDLVSMISVSFDDANEMIKDVTNEEIKDAIFDIKENKAPGPNGFSLKFFKKAWSVVGEDKLLLKSQTLGQLFFCNVIYKGISKILTNRIKKSLCKVVSTNQSAFIPGRQITDNILISQELLREYNWKNRAKRVSFKIDIQKAYDTINWGFLEKTLSLFGFPIQMIHWIMTCVRSAAFSINVNGEKHGYFKGGRGLRQDDLLMFCHGDVESVKVIKGALDEFSMISRLIPNMGKLSYLGVPLITKQPGINDCKCLVEKVKAKVNCWKNRMLTYVGRLQLISSVLSSIHVYWASVFMLPKMIINDINRLLKGFLWCQGDLTKGKAKVAWENVCLPKHQGGLGLKNLNIWNEVLMSKHLWNLASCKDSLWVQWVNVVKLKGRSIWEVNVESNSSCGWKQILSLRDKMRSHIVNQIGNGEKTFFWHDNWCDKGALSAIFGQDLMKHQSINTSAKGRLATQDRVMKWYTRTKMKCAHQLLIAQCPILVTALEDRLDLPKGTLLTICEGGAEGSELSDGDVLLSCIHISVDAISVVFGLSFTQDTVMSDSEDSTVTYTAVPSPFADLPDIRSPGVDGPPMMPKDLYAYVVAAFQATPSPDYLPVSEYPPSSDLFKAAEEQPLPDAVSPTVDSPGYVPESNPREDPEEDDDEDLEEDPTDYPTDGGDDGYDEDDSSDDDEDDDVDIKEDEEEEEHPAPADSTVVALPAVNQTPSTEETEPFETDESAATPPPYPAYRVTTRISI